MPIAFEPSQPKAMPHYEGGALHPRVVAARVRSSVRLGAIALVMILHGFSSAPAVWFGEDAGPRLEPKDVRIIDSAPSLDVPCEQQTWPYIHARCLTGGSAVPVRTVRPATDTPEFDPRNATAPVVAAPPARSATNEVPVNAAPAQAVRRFEEIEQRQRPQPRYYPPRVNIQ